MQGPLRQKSYWANADDRLDASIQSHGRDVDSVREERGISRYCVAEPSQFLEIGASACLVRLYYRMRQHHEHALRTR